MRVAVLDRSWRGRESDREASAVATGVLHPRAQKEGKEKSRVGAHGEAPVKY